MYNIYIYMGCSPKRFGNAFSFIVAVFHKPKNSTWMVDLETLDPLDPDPWENAKNY